MRFRINLRAVAVLCATFLSFHSAFSQQVIQRGALGVPSQVLDETEQWTVPILVASDKDVEIYIPDISNPEWLKRNYPDYENRGVYTLSFFTFYKTPAACRRNQINWGLGDAAHLSACADIGYRVRRSLIDKQAKSVTLQMAAMVDQNGVLDPESIEDRGVFRVWSQLDANTQTALQKANEFVAKQMAAYDRRMQSTR